MVEWVLVVFLVLLVAAALQDIASLKISNLFPLAIMLLFGIWVALVGVPDNIWQNILHFAVSLIAGMILFGLGWIGGGDAKLYASIALWFNLSSAISLLFFVSVSGLLLLVLMLLFRRWRNARTNGSSKTATPQKTGRMKLPYGVAIAAGAIAALHLQGVNPSGQQIFDPTAVSLPGNS